MKIFEYTDYRAFLKDFYTEQKRKNRAYSYRVFAQKAKLGSPNYLKLVVDGDRRITDKNLPQFIRGLRLSRQEGEYFKNLVFYEEANDVDAKAMYLEELLKIRKRVLKTVTKIDESRQEILKTWYHWAIREMILLKDFRNDPTWIAARLRHRITPKQAEESLKLLESLRFTSKENGKHRLSEPLISTTDEISSLLIRQLHRQFIELGVHSLFKDPLEAREVNGLTLAVPKSKIEEIKKCIKEFRKELNRNFSTDDGNEEVYHLVIEFFPLTKKADSL